MEAEIPPAKVNLVCSVQQLWDIPGQSRLRHVHLVHALFLGRKIVSRKKFTCAYIQDPENKDVYVPFVHSKARVHFEDVELQRGLLLVCSVIKNLKTGKQVLSSLVVDLWQQKQQQGDQFSFRDSELDFAPHGKGTMSLGVVTGSIPFDSDVAVKDTTVEREDDVGVNGHTKEKQVARMTISTIGTVPAEAWDRKRCDSDHPAAKEASTISTKTKTRRAGIHSGASGNDVTGASSSGGGGGTGGSLFPTEEVFEGAGREAGLQCWRVASSSSCSEEGDGAQKSWSLASMHCVDTEEIVSVGFSSSECYVLLHTAAAAAAAAANGTCAGKEAAGGRWQVHTWVGARAHRQLAEAAAFKAQLLARAVLPGVPVTANSEIAESEALLRILQAARGGTVSSVASSVAWSPVDSKYLTERGASAAAAAASSSSSAVLSTGISEASTETTTREATPQRKRGACLQIFPEVEHEDDPAPEVAGGRSPVAAGEQQGAAGPAQSMRVRGDSFIEEENERFLSLPLPSPSSAPHTPSASELSRHSSAALFIDVSSPASSPLLPFQRSSSFSDCDYDDDDSSTGGLSDYNLDDDEDCYEYEYGSSGSEDEGARYFSDEEEEGEDVPLRSPSSRPVGAQHVPSRGGGDSCRDARVGAGGEPEQGEEAEAEEEEGWLYEMDVIEHYCERQILAHAAVQRSHHHKMADSPTRVTSAYKSSQPNRNPFRSLAAPSLVRSPVAKKRGGSRGAGNSSSSRRGYTKGWVPATSSTSSSGAAAEEEVSQPRPSGDYQRKTSSATAPAGKEAVIHASANANTAGTSLYRIGYINEKLHVSRLAGLNSQDVDFGPPSRLMLQPKGVYILDEPDKVFLWTGAKSVGQLRAAGITFAKALIQHSRDSGPEEAPQVEVEGVLEGEESALFKQHFPDWRQWEKEEAAKRQAERQAERQIERLAERKQAEEEDAAVESSAESVQSKGLPGSNLSATVERRCSLPAFPASAGANPKVLSRGETAPVPRRNSLPEAASASVSRLGRPRRPSVVGVAEVDEEEETPARVQELLARDDGRGASVVWKIVDGSFVRVSEAEAGHFWVHETYVVLYGFTPGMDEHQRVVAAARGGDDQGRSDGDKAQRKAKPVFVVYFWQGPHGKPTAYTQWKLNIFPQKKEEWLQSMGKVPCEVRVAQGKEPLHFFKIFRRHYCVHFPFVEILEERKEKERTMRSRQLEILGREKQRDLERARQDPRVPAFLHAAAVRASGAASSSHKSTGRLPPPRKKSTSGRDHMTRTIDKYSCFVMEMSAGVLCFHVRGAGVDDCDVHAVQIEASACRLISSDCFITLRPLPDDKSSVWLWVGKGSEYSEQAVAGALARKLKQWFEPDRKCSLRVIEEGAVQWVERWAAKAFYRAMGGIDNYTNTKLLRIPRDERPEGLRLPVLFVCGASSGGDYSVRMLGSFSQSDLQPAGAVILDAHFAIFLWTGRECTPVLAGMARDVATKFLGNMRRGHVKLVRKVLEVEQDNELVSFVACFHGWCDWSMRDKTFVDPWQVRCEVRSSLGLMGEHRMGRVTNLPKKEVSGIDDKNKQTALASKRAPPSEEEARSRFRAATRSSSAKRREASPRPGSDSSVSSSKSPTPWSIRSPDSSLMALPLTGEGALEGDSSTVVSCSDKSASSKGAKVSSSKRMNFGASSSLLSPIETAGGARAGHKHPQDSSRPSPLQRLRERLRKMAGKTAPAPSSLAGFFSPLSLRGQEAPTQHHDTSAAVPLPGEH